MADNRSAQARPAHGGTGHVPHARTSNEKSAASSPISCLLRRLSARRASLELASAHGELPLPSADRAGVLVVQPGVDAHEVEVVRAPAPYDWRVITGSRRSRRAAIQRHVADPTHVVLARPRPAGHRVPRLDGYLHRHLRQWPWQLGPAGPLARLVEKRSQDRR
eukprot:CAMPEP_0185306462 /NCGR_PEP_ID=MMETSP1363-20130426/16104_1 /TAXON_ID=38817 /ORGANISM="Gephyrocapsa oceanica, Strain RCC1303" /LENGTH=163 /DNA_ID=CAMNT_0027903747 /DNA_START=598 /DNA_END=1086 /DNA_ORIENTATION=+